MTINEDHRQVKVAAQPSAQARTLAHSTQNLPAPQDSYDLLGELVATRPPLEHEEIYRRNHLATASAAA